MHKQMARQYVFNNSQCAVLALSTDATECTILQISVVANNSLGYSSQVSIEGINESLFSKLCI